MGKQLRVDVAELTDIGRRRAINQDNLALRIPDDPDELARDGALFIVADGMGGHAAGEIASSVAVQTICSTYFEAASGDVLQGLAQAIKRANEAILAIAHENHANAGMGTTMVVAVICQGILYVANIGDSRAYLIRNGRMRQLTEDHSWVADQVRAGVLTEEQARNHTHRNVITRSLGTQPNVIADVFVEPSREGDILILCSDGLHGYVDEKTIGEIVSSNPPNEAARRLIELANEAGGPDNISVSIVHVDEIPEASPDLLEKLRLLDGQDRPSRPMPIVASGADAQATPAPTPPAPLGERDAQPARKARRRSGALAVGLVACVVLIAFSAAAWDVILGPFAQSREVSYVVTRDVGKTKTDLAGLSSLSPSSQLSLLAGDQQLLQGDLKLNLTSSERTQIENELSTGLASAARQALQAYDTQASITPLSESEPVTFSLSCVSTGTTSLGTIAQLISASPPSSKTAPTPAPVVFARDQSGNVASLVIANGQATCGPVVATNVIDATSAGGVIGLLIQQPPAANSTTPGPLVVATLGPTDKAPKTILTVPAQLANQDQSIKLAVSNATIALAIQQGGNTTLYLFTAPKFDTTKPITLPMPSVPRSMAFGGNGLLYVLDDTGALETADPHTQSLHVVGNLAIQPVLPVTDPSQYSIQTPVPTVQASSDPTASLAGAPPASFSYNIVARAAKTPTPSPTATPTPLPTPPPRTGPSTMLPTAIDLAASQERPPRVIVADPQDYRLVILQGDGADMDLIEQMADASQLTHVTAATISADGHTVYLLDGQSIIQIDLP